LGNLTIIASGIVFSLVLFTLLPEVTRAQRTVEVRKLDFPNDPKWDALSNRLLPSPRPLVKQDFGPSETGHAGGRQKGESVAACSARRRCAAMRPKSSRGRLMIVYLHPAGLR
jgi:hypothetical protein